MCVCVCGVPKAPVGSRHSMHATPATQAGPGPPAKRARVATAAGAATTNGVTTATTTSSSSSSSVGFLHEMGESATFFAPRAPPAAPPPLSFGQGVRAATTPALPTSASSSSASAPAPVPAGPPVSEAVRRAYRDAVGEGRRRMAARIRGRPGFAWATEHAWHFWAWEHACAADPRLRAFLRDVDDTAAASFLLWLTPPEREAELARPLPAPGQARVGSSAVLMARVRARLRGCAVVPEAPALFAWREALRDAAWATLAALPRDALARVLALGALPRSAESNVALVLQSRIKRVGGLDDGDGGCGGPAGAEYERLLDGGSEEGGGSVEGCPWEAAVQGARRRPQLQALAQARRAHEKATGAGLRAAAGPLEMLVMSALRAEEAAAAAAAAAEAAGEGSQLQVPAFCPPNSGGYLAKTLL